MTISILELEQQLKTQFNVKVICDLGDLSTGANNLFKLLDSCYQDKYENNDRFIFYTSHIPSEQFFQHLYETANFIDISNWFITICGPEELHPIILSSCEKYSLDPVPFQFLSVDIANTRQIQNNFSLPDTMCAVPWTNIEIRQNGDITPCCMSSSTLGSINNISIEQAFRGDKLQKLRNSLLSGERPAECNSCWKVEEKNLSSIRMHNVKRLKKDFLTKYLDHPQIATLDIKFNNTCNFKCRICNPISSSLLAQEQHKFLSRPLVAQSNWSESPEFIDQIVEHLPHIHNIDMFGGEPFLIKKFSEVLKLAVEQDHAKNIRLHYNSNGSIWPGHFLPYWANFKLVDIHFSIDAVGKQFELQRGGNWHEVEHNILRLKELGLPNLSISIMPTISAMSVYYIDQVYDWALSHGFPIYVSHARGAGVELQDLTAKAKEIIIKKFKNHRWDELQKVIKIIQELPDSDGKEFQNKIEWFDRVRKENFSDSHSEIASAMGYVYNSNSTQ
jgi:radical SAM protein with 4Fe4S-binding SPASM domain